MLNDVMTKPLSPAAAKLAERIAAAQTKLNATRALMTDEDRAEQEQRDALAKIEEDERSAAAERRAIEMARRLDVAAEKVGNPALVRPLAVKGFDDTFIIQRDGAAHGRWEKDMAEAGSNSKIDRATVARKYAIASVFEWNGRDPDDSTVTHELNKFLTDNPGVVTSILGEAIELNGAVKEARKSAS